MERKRRWPPSHVRIAVVAAVAVVVIALLLAARSHPYARTVVWSAVLLASFVGWGSLVNLWLAPGLRLDWGLRAGWGMALSILTGGFLCVLHLAWRPVLIAQVAAGVVALLATARPPILRVALLHRRLTAWTGRAGVTVIVAASYGISIFTFFAYLGHQGFQPSDDPPLYFALAKRLVESGSLFDPFDGRRITTFGGQIYLHSLFISVAPIYYLHSVDGGLCTVIVMGLLVGHVRGSGLKAWHAVPIGLASLLLFSLGDVRVNTASLMSGVASIVTLYRTVRVHAGTDGPPWPMAPRRLIAVSALAVVSIVLRTSNTPAVLPFCVIVLASDFFLATRRPWRRESLRTLAHVIWIFAAAFVLALLPWSVMLKQSCGTFFYPIGHDNLTPGWVFLKPSKTWDEAARTFITNLFDEKPITLFVPFAIAGLALPNGSGRNALVALTLGSFVGIAAIAHEGASFGASVHRYYYAYVVATSLVVAASVGRSGIGASLVAAALAVHMSARREETREAFLNYVRMAAGALRETPEQQQAFDARTPDYSDVQSHIPAGKTFATAVQEDFRFDFRRNRIFSLDLLGGMGPKPGWPAQKGPEALGNYLKANGVDYLVWADFNLPGELYNRAHWQSHLGKTDSYLAAEAPLQLDAEDAIDKLALMRDIVYRGHGMIALDLSARTGASNARSP